MKQILTLTIIVLAAFASIGCIVGETNHLIYLEPDGAVTWVVFERDVRSIDGDTDKQLQQEDQFLAEVRDGSHPVAQGFDALTPRSIKHHLLRNIRPFSVWTEARFERADDLVFSSLDLLGVPALVEMWADGDLTTLEIIIMVDEAQEENVDERVLALVDDPEAYSIRLTRGSFVAAIGFEIEEDGAIARPAFPDEADRKEGEPLVLSLSWISK